MFEKLQLSTKELHTACIKMGYENQFLEMREVYCSGDELETVGEFYFSVPSTGREMLVDA